MTQSFRLGESGQYHRAAVSSPVGNGRTGRGDTCFATYLGQRLTRSAAEATRWAGAVTTLKQEKPGPWYGTMAEAKAIMPT